MIAAKYIIFLLTAFAFELAGASEDQMRNVLNSDSQDSPAVVIKGVRDPSEWFRIESQHLIVYSDDTQEQSLELVSNLERLDYLLRLYLKPFLIRQTNLPKLTLYFQRRVNWAPEIGAHPSRATGLVNSCIAGTQAFTFNVGKMWSLQNTDLLKAEDDMTLMWNMYLYASNFLYRHTNIRSPTWFIHGFGAYFGGMRFTDDQMLVGRAAARAYALLQAIDNGQIRYFSFDEVLGPVEPLKLTEQSKQWEYLGRAFNLVHYLLSSEENRSKMAQYLERVNNGDNSVVAFSGVFGLKGFDLDSTMWRYRQRDMKIYQINMPDLPKPKVAFTRLSRIEGEFVLDNALVKTCPADDNGKNLLERLKVKTVGASAVDFAQITLSRAQIEWGAPREAITYLTRAGERNSTNPEIWYLLGNAYLNLAETTGERDGRADLLAAARINLMRADALASHVPEISYALFRTGVLGSDPSKKDMDKAADAWLNGHDVAAFARAAALAYAWLGNTADAYQAFNSLVRDDRDPENAIWAAAWLSRLERGVSRDELLTAMRNERPTYSTARHWAIGYQ